jgi:hypothetical protein
MAADARTSLWFRLFLLAMRVYFLLSPLWDALAQTNSSQPVLVLESISTTYGMGGKDVQMLVRLKQDGAVS